MNTKKNTRFTVKLSPATCSNRPAVCGKIISNRVLHKQEFSEEYGVPVKVIDTFLTALKKASQNNDEVCFDNEMRAYNCRDAKTEKAYLYIRTTGTLRDCCSDAELVPVDVDLKPTTKEAVMKKARAINKAVMQNLAERLQVPTVKVTCPNCGHEFAIDRPYRY